MPILLTPSFTIRKVISKYLSYLKFVILPFLLIVFIYLGKLLIWDNLKIKKIIIISKDTSILGLSIFNQNDFLFFDPLKAKQHLLKSNFYLDDVSIEKKFPQTLIVNLSWRKPQAFISDKNKTIYIDKQGFPAKIIDNLEFTLPEIIGAKISLNQNQPDWKLAKSVALIETLHKLDIRVHQIILDDAAALFILYLDDDTQIFVSQKSDIAYIVSSLQTIISRFRIEGKFISKIDYRFDKPLVILKNE